MGKVFALVLAWAFGLAGMVFLARWAVESGLLTTVLLGLGVGLALRWAWRATRRAADPAGGRSPVTAPGVSPRPGPVVAALVVGLVGIVVLALALWPTVGFEPQPSEDVTGLPAIYRASVELTPRGDSLRIREGFAFAVEEVRASLDLLSRPEAFRPEAGEFLVPDGWEGSLAGDSLRVSRERAREVDVSLRRMTSIVRLNVPRVSYDGPILWARPGSRVELDLPRHFFVDAFPPVASTADLVDPRGLERSVIPITVGVGDSREVRLRVLHPALRHGVGENLSQASLFAPLKWALLALAAIFAEQIKRGLLVPVARRTAEILRLPLFQG